MKLNYKKQGHGKPIILLHGLFGNLDNLGILARSLVSQHEVIQIDLRNHGLSFWHHEMNYAVMANDVINIIEALSLPSVTLIGHSMGGKVAMKIAEISPHLIDKMIILDIAPTVYQVDSHQPVFKAINDTFNLPKRSRQAVEQSMRDTISDAIVQFLLKSYKDEQWLFNFKVIESHYPDIRGWQSIAPSFLPVLFIKGDNSRYITDMAKADILQQFPYSIIETVDGAGHNVHFDQPSQVLNLVKQWLL